jgi:predicted transcriptional regulator
MYELPTPEDLKRYRLSVHLTQTELARMAGVSQSLIARIEAGDIDPKLSTLRKILNAIKEKDLKRGLVASDAMTSPLIHVEPESTLVEASYLMEKHGISQLPVLENGVQIGSISEEVVVKEMTEVKDSSKLQEKTVKSVMAGGFPTVSPSTDLETLSKILERSQAALVVDMGKAIGVVTKADIIKLGMKRFYL